MGVRRYQVKLRPLPPKAEIVGPFRLTSFYVGYLMPMIYFIWSLRYGKIAPANPWGATGLEWQTSSPPPEHNFESLPPITSRRPVWDAMEAQQSRA